MCGQYEPLKIKWYYQQLNLHANIVILQMNNLIKISNAFEKKN